MSGNAATHLDRVVARVTDRHPACGDAAALLRIRERDPGAHDALHALLSAGDRRLDERFARLAGTPGVPLVTSLEDAIRDIGFRRVHAAALVATTINELSEVSTSLDPLRFWRYACATGTLATLSAVVDDQLADEAFPAGFFHAIGRLVLDQHAPDEFARVAHLVEEERFPVLSAETAIYGFTEADLGSRLALRWGFPGWLVESQLNAALPDEDVTRAVRGLPMLVLRARLAARTRGFGTEFEPSDLPPAGARWLVEPLLFSLDRLGGDSWLEGRVHALLRVALLEES